MSRVQRFMIKESRRNAPTKVVRLQRRAPIQSRAVRRLNRRVSRIERDVEVKFHTLLPLNATQVNDSNAPATFYLLNGIAQGDTASTREGNSIRMTSLHMNYSFQLNGSDATPTRFRIIVFYDNYASNTQPTIISGDASVGLLSNTSIGDPTYMPPNQNVRERFKILHDQIATVVPPGAFTGGTIIDKMQSYRKRIRLNKRVRYNSANNGYADITNHSLWVYVCSDKSLNLPYATLATRLYYKDA